MSEPLRISRRKKSRTAAGFSSSNFHWRCGTVLLIVRASRCAVFSNTRSGRARTKLWIFKHKTHQQESKNTDSGSDSRRPVIGRSVVRASCGIKCPWEESIASTSGGKKQKFNMWTSHFPTLHFLIPTRIQVYNIAQWYFSIFEQFIFYLYLTHCNSETHANKQIEKCCQQHRRQNPDVSRGHEKLMDRGQLRLR